MCAEKSIVPAIGRVPTNFRQGLLRAPIYGFNWGNLCGLNSLFSRLSGFRARPAECLAGFVIRRILPRWHYIARIEP